MSAPHRARIIGRKHMAAAGHYLAAQAAFQALEAGGNAVDAGVAGGIALGVLQSEYVSFGGVAPIMIRMAETGEVVTLSGLGHWPALTDVEHFRRNGGRIPKGILRTVVPAAPDAWITALERFGTMSYGEVALAARRFAREGFAVPSLMTDIIAAHAEEYASWETSAPIFLPGGKPPQPGDLFVQSDLADTIDHMIAEEAAAAARGGRLAGLQAARDAFYRGDIARTIVAYHETNGGWLRMDDLANFRVEQETARRVSFRGMEVHSCGAWCQGPVLAQTLGMLDGQDLVSLGHNSSAYIHRIVETLKLAYADRHAYFGDPNFVDVPLDELLSPAYMSDRAKLVDTARAAPGMPEPGLPRDFAAPAPHAARPEDAVSELDTSYVCTVDAAGNAFSATPSDGSAAAPVIPGLGFVPSNRGMQSWVEADAPAVLGPGRRPRLTPSPAMAVKPGEWVMPFGSPGNDVQPQAMLQTFLNIHLWGMAPQQAVDEPRFATFSYPRSSEPHSYDPGLLRVEARIGPDTQEELRALGHDVREWPEWEYAAGAVCTIVANERTGMREGASDQRRPTAVAGW
ncbi:gamma-glutamyltransferase family protein [Lutibaculum baratangense]|uniref:Gamma-glutamyltranspeptidase n=1 Tax=Lutibaculum baratangense AMV1 TaxID=631454 RepID=V4R643_9HYPH|nr:gamma-glutamyltransferase [Lutibaculum baratangense]ESR27387.1 Gamma-glutamyltranspeptidase [Lutibaculum baratangense AMV1]